MRKLYRLLLILPLLATILIPLWFIRGHTVALMDTKGIIATKERNLILFTAFLSLFVVIPVFTLAIVIAWKYRATNTKATYKPDWGHSTRLETIWWGIPCALILVLSVVTWQSAHALDPFKPIASTTKPVIVDVVALDWKWLFIYPQQHIATVNFLEIPTGTPVSFAITSDAPMNSFSIPQLGGQIYAMQGMTTALQLVANAPGSYRGESANLSGEGFSSMYFNTKAVSAADFSAWTASMQRSPHALNATEYAALAQPSTGNKTAYYTLSDTGLYNSIVMKYMMPMSMNTGPSNSSPPEHAQSPSKNMQGMAGMDMQ